MSPLALVIILFVAGAILLLGELILPTHGVLGILGGLLVAAGVVQCFMLGRWIGFFVLVALVVASPFFATWILNLYPRTPIGRRMILQDEPSIVRPPPVHIGQEGIAMTRLCPGGEVEFDAQRLEVISEYGIIPPGRRVRVVAIANNRAVVREA
jgi:membrane-bound ClpP family serine protease